MGHQAIAPPQPQLSPSVRYIQINAEYAGQRLDNFLLTALKGVPRSLVYKILRTGEVRVNKGRAKAGYRVCDGDQIRLPPPAFDGGGTTHIPARWAIASTRSSHFIRR